MKIDSKFIDADFPVFPEYMIGSIIPENAQEICAALPAYEDAVPPIPSSQWKEIADETTHNKTGNEWLVSRIFNQANEGACVGNAWAQMIETKQAKQFGKENVVGLSACSAYQLIGRSPNSGAMVSDAMEMGKTKGVIPRDTPENRERFGNIVMPDTGFYTKRPAGWEPVAANFCMDEVYVVRTYEGIITAGLTGDGAQVGRDGHSIYYLRPTFETVNDPIYHYVNSWRESWGYAMAGFKGGFGGDSIRTIKKSAGWAFVVRSIRVPKWIAA